MTFLTVYSVLALALLSDSYANESGSEQDCSEAGVDYDKSSGKTKDEIIAEMDRALYESLNRYDGCVSQKKNSGSSSGGGAAGSDGGGSATSSASSGIEGSEPTISQSQRNQQANTIEGEETKLPAKTQDRALENGKITEDIPPADNDNILQKKI
ncbi:MAG: hypothetical protein WD185_00375 [Sneathiella sp.]